MDLAEVPTEDLQNRNIELLQIMHGLRNGIPHAVTREQCVANKAALQEELRRRGATIRASTRVSTPESAALLQRLL